jgi:menaquinone-dependent protoporphyrinogen IX oxidase
MIIADSLEQALEIGTNYFKTDRVCANGHQCKINYINSKKPLKTRCWECQKIASLRKKKRSNQDPAKLEKSRERIRSANRKRYAEDAEYRAALNEKIKSRLNAPVLDVEGKTRKYIADAIAVHGDKYDYSKFQYFNSQTSVTIICKIHGEFQQSIQSHIREGRDCPECMKSFSVSKSENEMADYVESLGFDLKRNVRNLIGKYELDVYIESKRLAVEYCGLRWHSTAVRKANNYEELKVINRNAAGKHKKKHDACAEAGIRLITIFEDEWLDKPGVVKKTLQHILGVSTAKIHARAMTLRMVDTHEIRKFYDDNHLQGSPQSGVSVIGEIDGRVVCAMSFAKAYSDRGKSDGSWELSRFCSECSIPGAASRLFKQFVKSYRPERVISYSDNRWFIGDMYKTLGFVFEHEVPPNYWVTKQQKRWHKTNFKRAAIPLRLKEFGIKDLFNPETDPRTELEMTHRMGCGRIYDCGKKRWVWTNPAFVAPSA